MLLRIIGSGFLLTSGIAIGMFINAGATPAAEDPAGFLIVAGKTLDTTGLDAYAAAAGNAISSAGLKRVARSAEITPARILEGSWPYDGFVAIERVQSIDKLATYWNSDEFQRIKTLRDGKIEIHFAVVVEANAGRFERQQLTSDPAIAAHACRRKPGALPWSPPTHAPAV